MKNKSILIAIMVLALCSIPIILMLVNIKADISNVPAIEEVYPDISKQEPNKQNNSITQVISTEKIKNLFNDLARNSEFIDINGEKVRIAQKAYWDLKKIGEPVIPYLVEELKTNGSLDARRKALGIISDLINKDDKKLMEYLPVFVGYLKDKEPAMRRSSVTIIGEMAIRFKFYKKQEYLDKAIPYIVEALNDTDKDVKHVAGEYFLKQITKEDVLTALNEFDKSASHEFDSATGYYLVYKEKHYPPTVVIGLAARRLLGRTLESDEYSGIEEVRTYKCVDILRNFGFEIIEKDIGK